MQVLKKIREILIKILSLVAQAAAAEAPVAQAVPAEDCQVAIRLLT